MLTQRNEVEVLKAFLAASGNPETSLTKCKEVALHSVTPLAEGSHRPRVTDGLLEFLTKLEKLDKLKQVKEERKAGPSQAQ